MNQIFSTFEIDPEKEQSFCHYFFKVTKMTHLADTFYALGYILEEDFLTIQYPSDVPVGSHKEKFDIWKAVGQMKCNLFPPKPFNAVHIFFIVDNLQPGQPFVLPSGKKFQQNMYHEKAEDLSELLNSYSFHAYIAIPHIRKFIYPIFKGDGYDGDESSFSNNVLIDKRTDVVLCNKNSHIARVFPDYDYPEYKKNSLALISTANLFMLDTFTLSHAPVLKYQSFSIHSRDQKDEVDCIAIIPRSDPTCRFTSDGTFTAICEPKFEREIHKKSSKIVQDQIPPNQNVIQEKEEKVDPKQLVFAASSGNLEFVKLHITSFDAQDCLNVASNGNHPHIIKFLLSKFKELDLQIPLARACKARAIQSFHELFKHGAKLKNIFECAANYPPMKKVAQILLLFKEFPIDSEGYLLSPYKVAKDMCVDIHILSEVEIKRKIPFVDSIDDVFIHACSVGNLEKAKLLFSLGAKDLNKAAVNSAKSGAAHILRFVLESGATNLDELLPIARGASLEFLQRLIG